MDLEAFQAGLAGLFGGDLRADHPVDRRFAAVLADVPGMATENKLALLNLAAAHLEPGEAYLEVGSFKGLSLIGAMLGNPGRRFYAIENFLEFNPDGTARAELEANLARWAGSGRARVLEGDCFDLLRTGAGLEEPVGVYFYDGAHGRLPHYLALGVAERWLADRALVVIDDASWPIVARVTPPIPATGCCSTWRPSTRRTRAGGTGSACTPSSVPQPGPRRGDGGLTRGGGCWPTTWRTGRRCGSPGGPCRAIPGCAPPC
jgi:predicted O-methyltransferase YrrM